MGLSRNKVAVPEGAAGTPPFWSSKKDDVKENTEDKRQTLSYFSQKVLFRYKEKDEAEPSITLELSDKALRADHFLPVL